MDNANVVHCPHSSMGNLNNELDQIRAFISLLSSGHVLDGMTEELKSTLKLAACQIPNLFQDKGSTLNSHCFQMPSFQIRRNCLSKAPEISTTTLDCATSVNRDNNSSLTKTNDVSERTETKHVGNCLEMQKKSTSVSMASKIAQNMMVPMRLERDAMPTLPMTILANLSESFLSVIESRLILLLAALSKNEKRNSARNHPRVNNSRIPDQSSILKKILKEPNAIRLLSVMTKFDVISTSNVSPSVDSALIYPVSMQCMFDFDVLGTRKPVCINVEGSLKAYYARNECQVYRCFSSAELSMEADTVLSSMMENARSIEKIVLAEVKNKTSSLMKEFRIKNGKRVDRPKKFDQYVFELRGLRVLREKNHNDSDDKLMSSQMKRFLEAKMLSPPTMDGTSAIKVNKDEVYILSAMSMPPPPKRIPIKSLPAVDFSRNFLSRSLIYSCRAA